MEEQVLAGFTVLMVCAGQRAAAWPPASSCLGQHLLHLCHIGVTAVSAHVGEELLEVSGDRALARRLGDGVEGPVRGGRPQGRAAVLPSLPCGLPSCLHHVHPFPSGGPSPRQTPPAPPPADLFSASGSSRACTQISATSSRGMERYLAPSAISRSSTSSTSSRSPPCSGRGRAEKGRRPKLLSTLEASPGSQAMPACAALPPPRRLRQPPPSRR